MNTVPEVDLAVVGLGAFGAAAAWHGRRYGLSVIGFDRYDPPHTLGSTHAETRITRLAVGEGPQYLPFVARSHELWRELEVATGTTVFHECGGLIVCPPGHADERWTDFVGATERIAAGAGIDYHRLSPAEAMTDVPLLRLADDALVGFEPTAGLLMAEDAVAGQLEMARRLGADIVTSTAVDRLEPDVDGVWVHTAAGSVQARHVLMATGAWTPAMAPADVASPLHVTRQVVFWFATEEGVPYGTDDLRFVMWVGDTIDDYVCVFPSPPGATPGIKIMGEQFHQFTTADAVDRTVTDDEIDAFWEHHIAPKFTGISRDCLRAEVCLYTNTPDEHFLIDADPRDERITWVSACSGHGFKHSTAVAEALAERVATGRSSLDLSSFGRRSFG